MHSDCLPSRSRCVSVYSARHRGNLCSWGLSWFTELITYKMLLSPPTYFGLDAQLRQIPFKFYIIQVVLYYHGSFSTNVQTYKSFKLHFIQDSYSLWRQAFYKHSDLQIIQAFFYSRQLKYGVSLPSNLQIIQAFFHSSQLFSMASAFLQTFRSSNHSSFLLFKPAIQCGVSLSTNIHIFKSFKLSFNQASCSTWRQPFYKHSYLQIIQNFFYSRQHCRVASAFSIHTAISSEIAFLVIIILPPVFSTSYIFNILQPIQIIQISFYSAS